LEHPLPYQPPELNLTDPTKNFLHFVIYTEPSLSIASNSLNADISIEPVQTQSRYFQEWLSRLVRCEPNALHCTLVEQQKIPALFHPCVEDDKASPSAVGGSGCVCRRTFYDPEFGLPVVGEHFKHVGTGGLDQWTYQTYAPLDLRPHDTFSSFITERGLFWARTEKGALSILPQQNSRGYNIGYSGGGPHALAGYLTQLADSDGQNTAAGAEYNQAHPAILAWTQSEAADRGVNELTLRDLKAMRG
jgi:hypothetical protein